LTPQFNQNVQRLINFLNNNKFIKIYINYPNQGVIAHRPICPDKPNLICGYGDATRNGFWVGMLRKEGIVQSF